MIVLLVTPSCFDDWVEVYSFILFLRMNTNSSFSLLFNKVKLDKEDAKIFFQLID